jgi:hypothetical protein
MNIQMNGRQNRTAKRKNGMRKSRQAKRQNVVGRKSRQTERQEARKSRTNGRTNGRQASGTRRRRAH